MPRFFVPESSVGTDAITISGQDAFHIGRSLRMRVGDELTVCSGGKDHICKLAKISDELCVADIVSVSEGSGEPGTRLTLYQAVPKGDKAELIVQKAVELGAAEICFVDTHRCVSRPDGKSWEKKMKRYERIALEAAKQCGRSAVPEVGGIIGFRECVKSLENHEKGLMCYEKGGARLSHSLNGSEKDIGLLIGSEGGFEESEAEAAKAAGVQLITLGSRILRCETAPLAAISVVMSIVGEI
ncbi:MAG: 16S rRNA (uracil(1498)-N(3))-methyltransferase [Ruminococcus sp.]|nr:16S rRNA (uracil(1498)-N(3))-methyltransferase [Ruminococcus sp.]